MRETHQEHTSREHILVVPRNQIRAASAAGRTVPVRPGVVRNNGAAFCVHNGRQCVVRAVLEKVVDLSFFHFCLRGKRQKRPKIMKSFRIRTTRFTRGVWNSGTRRRTHAHFELICCLICFTSRKKSNMFVASVSENMYPSKTESCPQ